MSDDQVTHGSEIRTRRALLAGAGAVGASVLLAACGSDDSKGGQAPNVSPTTAGEPEDNTTGGATGSGSTLAKTSEIPVGGGKIIPSSSVVVTQPTAGQFKAFSAICTHQGCPVSSVDGGTINCTCHGSRFSISDGSPQTGPATQALAAKNVKVNGGNVTLA